MLFPYYIAVDSTPNLDVSKTSKKSKQNARSKWDAPDCIRCLLGNPGKMHQTAFSAARFRAEETQKFDYSG
jgi:hypothetical protein